MYTFSFLFYEKKLENSLNLLSAKNWKKVSGSRTLISAFYIFSVFPLLESSHSSGEHGGFGGTGWARSKEVLPSVDWAHGEVLQLLHQARTPGVRPIVRQCYVP
jgi:hypothetical protein